MPSLNFQLIALLGGIVSIAAISCAPPAPVVPPTPVPAVVKTETPLVEPPTQPVPTVERNPEIKVEDMTNLPKDDVFRSNPSAGVPRSGEPAAVVSRPPTEPPSRIKQKEPEPPPPPSE